MCTSSEIVVTTNIIITVRPSTWTPAPRRTPPFWNHVVLRVIGSMSVAWPPSAVM